MGKINLIGVLSFILLFLVQQNTKAFWATKIVQSVPNDIQKNEKEYVNHDVFKSHHVYPGAYMALSVVAGFIGFYWIFSNGEAKSIGAPLGIATGLIVGSVLETIVYIKEQDCYARYEKIAQKNVTAETQKYSLLKKAIIKRIPHLPVNEAQIIESIIESIEKQNSTH